MIPFEKYESDQIFNGIIIMASKMMDAASNQNIIDVKNLAQQIALAILAIETNEQNKQMR